MNQHYNQNYTKDQIFQVLLKIHRYVRIGKYLIAKNENRMENKNLILKYNLTTKKQQRIIMQIKLDDFCHSVQNNKSGYEYEILYVFCPQITLYNLNDEQEQVDLYTKFNLIDSNSGSLVIVVSFHERKKPVNYLFRTKFD